MKLRQIEPEPIGYCELISSPERSKPCTRSAPSSVSHECSESSQCTSSCSSPSSEPSKILALVHNEIDFVPSAGRPCPDVITIYFNSLPKYTLERIRQRHHCWFLKTTDGQIVARLRASQCFSWLELIDEEGKPEKISQHFCMSNATLEWYRRGKSLSIGVDTIRWQYPNAEMVSICNGIVQIPALASLSSLKRCEPSLGSTVWNRGKLSAQECVTPDVNSAFPASTQLSKASHALAFSMHWRQPADRDKSFEHVVICTAAIAHWKWSRDWRITDRVAQSVHDPVMCWLGRNLEVGPNMGPLNRLLLRHPALRCLQSVE